MQCLEKTIGIALRRKICSMAVVSVSGIWRAVGSKAEAIMMNFQLIPVLTPSGGNTAGLPAKHPQSFGETLNELVVVIFFSLGPILGATIFLLWFGGLMWGLFSSFLR